MRLVSVLFATLTACPSGTSTGATSKTDASTHSETDADVDADADSDADTDADADADADVDADSSPTGDTGPSCADPYDPHVTVGTAIPLVADETLQVSDAQPDWWTITLDPNALVLLDTDELQVSFEVTDELGTPQWNTGRGVHLGNSGGAPRVVHLRVVPPSLDCTEYTIRRDDSTQPPCGAADAVGDDWTTAVLLSPHAYYSGTWYGGDYLATDDVDWYRLDIPEGARGSFDVWGADDGIQVDLYDDPTLPPIASWSGAYSKDYIPLEMPQAAPVDATYYLRLERVGAHPGCPFMDVYAYPW